MLSNNSMSDSELASELIPHFLRLHIDFQFPVVYAPSPGTLDCVIAVNERASGSTYVNGSRDMTGRTATDVMFRAHSSPTTFHKKKYLELVNEMMPSSKRCS
jgi:hypothetical protein